MKIIKELIRNRVAEKLNISVGEVSILNAGSGFVTYRTDIKLLANLIRTFRPVQDRHLKLIRFGPSGDGGYLIPDDLDGIEACFSPGVSGSSGFERQCADSGINVFMADKSVDGPAEKHDRFHFLNKFVGSISNDDFVTMDEWVHAFVSNQSSDLILQMDIEGDEYGAILQMSEELINRFRIIVIEFHALDQLWGANFFRLASCAFAKILKNHRCVHLHPNNDSAVVKWEGLEIPPVMEFTFIRADRLLTPGFVTELPHALDCDCTSRPTLNVPDCWYKEQYGLPLHE